MNANGLLMNGLSALHVAIANPSTTSRLYCSIAAPTSTRRAGLDSAPSPDMGAASERRQGAGAAGPHQHLDSLKVANALLDRGAAVNARQAEELCIGGFADAGFQRLVTPSEAPERAFWLPCNNDLNGARINLNRTGATPFLLAAQHADIEMMQLLRAHGADTTILTTERQTPLMVAAGVGIFGVGESPGTNEEAFEAVKLLVEWGADVTAADANGDTALHGAALRGANEIATLLVDRGARLDAANATGWTPLTVADGVLYTFTVKVAPQTAVLLRELMAKQGLPVPAPAPMVAVTAGPGASSPQP